MVAGDVLLLEAQTSMLGLDKLPVEVEEAVFDAIRHTVDQGIVVVEAGGNGGHDLDAFADANKKKVLNFDSSDYKDSGAIMVGAASSAAPHSRLDFSNYGSRIDCFAWGENIDTTGDGWKGTSKTEYTSSFGGTSGASPIVTGAAILLQAWRNQTLRRTYSPEHVRALLSDDRINTPSADPANDRIGVMPNLRAIIERERENQRFRPTNERYVSFAHILIGIIDDAPGLIWVPGKGPVPVDPGWRAMVRSVSQPKRDLIAALAVAEIAGQLRDGEARAAVNAGAATAMHCAVDAIAGRQR